jgi:hypothetical protein
MGTDGVDLRYSRAAKGRDVILAFGMALFPGALLADYLKDRWIDDLRTAHVFACWAAASAPIVLVFGLWRWGRRGWVDADGVSYAESARGPVKQLVWREIEEIYCVGREGFALAGSEVRIRFTDEFSSLGDAWSRIGRYRGAALRVELGRRFADGETLHFRGPDSREVGWIRAGVFLAIVLPLLGMASYAMTLGGGEFGCGFVFFAFLATFIVFTLAAIRERYGWVEVGPAGLTVQGKSRVDCRWEQLHSMGTEQNYGLVFQTTDGLRFGIPRDVANFMFLEELIRKRKGG